MSLSSVETRSGDSGLLYQRNGSALALELGMRDRGASALSYVCGVFRAERREGS